MQLLRPVSHSKAHQFSLFSQIIDLWNSLPHVVHTCDILNLFKHSLLQLNCVYTRIRVPFLVSILLLLYLCILQKYYYKNTSNLVQNYLCI